MSSESCNLNLQFQSKDHPTASKNDTDTIHIQPQNKVELSGFSITVGVKKAKLGISNYYDDASFNAFFLQIKQLSPGYSCSM